MSQSSEITVEKQGDDNRGAYTVDLEGVERQAELTWVTQDGVRHANHTFVPPEMRGKGIAGKLVDALMADARTARELSYSPYRCVASLIQQVPRRCRVSAERRHARARCECRECVVRYVAVLTQAVLFVPSALRLPRSRRRPRGVRRRFMRLR